MESNWIKEQEVTLFKKWQEFQLKLHWDNYRLNSEVDNKNTNLWKKLRRKSKQ